SRPRTTRACRCRPDYGSSSGISLASGGGVLRLVVVWILHTLALLAVAYLMPSVRIESFATALIAAALLGLANTVIRPLLILLTPDGKLKRSKAEFVEAHRGWLAMKNWTLQAKPVEIYEGASLGVAVLHLDYCEDQKRSESYLTLVFERRGEQWLMVQDQN